MANTACASAGAPPSPTPSADQVAPFHFAMRFAATPPAFRNEPPAYSSSPFPDPSSNTASTATGLLVPLPSGDQALPSHFAMRLAGAPPAFMNPPPAKSAGPPPEPSS